MTYTQPGDDPNFHKQIDNSDTIKIRISCFNGTLGGVTYFKPSGSQRNVDCPDTSTIGTGQELKGHEIEFTGSGNNPDEGDFSITHTILKNDVEMFSYNFPGDYTGSDEFDESDDHVDYRFTLTFE